MHQLLKLFILFFKAVFLGIGGLMLIGGGICSATMAVNLFGNNGKEIFGLLVISLLCTAAGWFILKAILTSSDTPSVTLSDIENDKK